MDDPPNNAILTLGIPSGALCGIDLLSFTTSTRFQGIKNIPTGWHFLFTSSTASLSLRHGVWIHIDETPATNRSSSAPDILIKKWDSEKEELIDVTEDETERLRWTMNLDKLWHDRLMPYRQQQQQTVTGDDGGEGRMKHDWKDLTNCITPTLLSRITGGKGDRWCLTSVSSARQDMDHIPGLSSSSGEKDKDVIGKSYHHHHHAGGGEEKELRFIPIDLKQTWRPGAIGRERTDAAQDRSWALGEMIRNHCVEGERELLGEMQLTFLAVLTLGNYSCMEQWKRILNLVLTCQAAIKDRPRFFKHFLALLRLQLRHCDDVEGGLFDLSDSDQGGAMLKLLLKRFRRGLDDVVVVVVRGDHDELGGVREEFDELEAFLKAELRWELDDSYVRSGKLQLEDGEEVDMDVNDLEAEDETGEYAPVVVDLGEDHSLEHG